MGPVLRQRKTGPATAIGFLEVAGDITAPAQYRAAPLMLMSKRAIGAFSIIIDEQPRQSPLHRTNEKNIS